MATRELFILILSVAIVFASESEDVEQKKRGAGKPNVLNSIPTGAQKTDYSYNFYSQNPITQNSGQNYQVPNSFYPNQANQFYTSNSQDSSHANPSTATNAPQVPQYIPINFVPNSVYQPKYQIVPSKSNGNIQLLLQPSPFPSSQIYPQMVISPNANVGQNPVVMPQNQFNFPHYQLPAFGHPFISQPSMFLYPHMSPQFLNNPGYSVQPQSVYYPVNQQGKQQQTYTSTNSNEYDKTQSQTSAAKEENDISNQNADYNTSFRNTYTKL
ncbi:unnamed protein product [Leptidea sinapis]|uniref:Uncharacterized protein n=1 Tax=Leptidea sinapis TaxID=189913 RepID=A0A5E4R5H3_9NEOP|nr:unnamed protein product [Leptidea sinapis]